MELPRTRDVIVLVKNRTFPVRIDSALKQGGWPGGQGVIWTDSGQDDFTVTYSDGFAGGFLLWGSNEDADQFIAQDKNQPTYDFAVACFGSWIISTSTFERYTLQSRLVPPLVENVYVPGEVLYFSERGFFTSQDEWTISGDPRAPNPTIVGTVIQPPAADNSNFLMLQTIL